MQPLPSMARKRLAMLLSVVVSRSLWALVA